MVTKALTDDVAIKLYNSWVAQRLKRPPFIVPADLEETKELGLKNLMSQSINPRKEHLKELKQHTDKMKMADIVTLLVNMELPVVETTTLFTKLTLQLKRDPQAKYFSKVNQADNCGCGCGCGCFALVNLSYEEKILQHRINKPHSIDPFNELGIPDKKRDDLLIKDFLTSYKKISKEIYKQIDGLK